MITRPSAPSVLAIQFGIERHDVDLSLTEEPELASRGVIVNDPPYDLDGDGVQVMVYDGGKVFAHADLAGRLTVGQSDTSGTSDHATHVACTIAGDGGNLAGQATAVRPT